MSDTPRTDALLSTVTEQTEPDVFGMQLIEHARQLERDLSAARRELAEVRDALKDIADGPRPIEDYKFGIRCGLEDRDLQTSDAYTASEYGYEQGLDWCADIAQRALKSPAQGATINAAGQASGEQSPHFARGQENKPTPAAPSTAPATTHEVSMPNGKPTFSGAIQTDELMQHSAVPDDPVAVWEELGRQNARLFAAHYMRKTARIVERRAEDRVHSTANYDAETNAWEYPKHAEDVGNALDEEADDCVKAILSAAAELERKP